MTILYFYQYFSTPKGSWGTRVYEFGKKWVAQGHRVIVVTSVYSKSDLVASRFIERQLIDGIEVIIVNIKVDNKLSFIKRVTGFTLYAIVGTFYAITIKCDRVIASSGPITVAIPGLAAKLIRGVKLVFEVRDLWPQGAIELGLLKNKIVKKFAYWIESLTYKKSDLVVTLSPGMVKNIDDRYGLGYKCISIPNAVNLSLFSPNRSSIQAGDVNEKYSYAIYTGNIGDVNNSFWLLNAARELKNRGIDNIKIIMVGDGQQKGEILNCIAKENLTSLKVMDLMPKNELVPMIQKAIVSLVPLKGTPILDTSSPNKFFESLGAGVPVIQNTNGWMKEFLMQNQVGVTINPNDHILLVDEIIRMNEMSFEDKMLMSKRCLKVAKQFDKDTLAESMMEAILKI